MDTNNQQPTQPENKNSKVIYIIIAIIILLLLGWYFLKGPGNKLKSSTSTTGTVQTQNNQNPAMSLKDLMAGGPQKCDVNYSNENSQSQGTVYVSGGKMRGDFTSQVNGKIETTHMINDGQTEYMWMEGSSQAAFKMSLSALPQGQSQPSGTPNQPQQPVDLEAKHDYRCSGWNGDSSQFNPPSNITFTDYSEMMKNMQTPPHNQSGASGSAGAAGSANVKAMQCAACDSLSGSQKTQCKAALSCN